VDITLRQGETLVILGESGSGKSVTAQAIMGVVPSPPGTVSADRLLQDGVDLQALTPAQHRRVRGKEMALIFQDALTSLNPRFRIGYQICEMLRHHLGLGLGRREARARAVSLLAHVGISSPDERLDAYPHQVSGGMRQRALIAMSVALGPKLLIADEPTTALDVTVQAQVLDLILRLQAEAGMGLILITNDMAVARRVADRVAVMYAGRVVAQATRNALFRDPRHPYTRGLMWATPSAAGLGGARQAENPRGPILSIRGLGCHFTTRRRALLRRRAQVVRALDGDSLDLEPGRTFGIVGESGSGKSTLARYLVRLERPTSGEILFEGRDLATLDETALRPVHRDVQMVFQDPWASLNPRHTVREILTEPWKIHDGVVPAAKRLRLGG